MQLLAVGRARQPAGAGRPFGSNRKPAEGNQRRCGSGATSMGCCPPAGRARRWRAMVRDSPHSGPGARPSAVLLDDSGDGRRRASRAAAASHDGRSSRHAVPARHRPYLPSRQGGNARPVIWRLFHSGIRARIHKAAAALDWADADGLGPCLRRDPLDPRPALALARAARPTPAIPASSPTIWSTSCCSPAASARDELDAPPRADAARLHARPVGLPRHGQGRRAARRRGRGAARRSRSSAITTSTAPPPPPC